jgi:hypothetical protein
MSQRKQSPNEIKIPWNYKSKAVLIYGAAIFLLLLSTYIIDVQRFGIFQTRISVSPDSISMLLHPNDTIIKRVEMHFELTPANVVPFVDGLNLGNFVKLYLTKNSPTDYFLYVNGTAPKNSGSTTSLEGAIRITYDIKSGNQSTGYEKVLPLNVTILQTVNGSK